MQKALRGGKKNPADSTLSAEPAGSKRSAKLDFSGGPFVFRHERGQIAAIGGFGFEGVTFVAFFSVCHFFGDFGIDF